MLLLEPYDLGPIRLKNRIVMAPLTRNRARHTIPGPLNAFYYRQRASASLIITEATQVDPFGQGYPETPGIHSEAQVEGWRLVTKAVHEAGGRIFLQLWHVGRISHPLFHGGQLPVAPSAIRPAGEAFTYEGPKPFVTPRALETDEIPSIIAQYKRAAENARAAGFDGVEVHSANGYLLAQFLQSGTNRRTDRYGGSVENRARLLLEVVEAVARVWGPDRVGVRLSPGGHFNDMHDDDPAATFTYVARRLNDYGLAYLHVINEPDVVVLAERDGRRIHAPELLREHFDGPLIAAGDYTPETGEQALHDGHANLIAFGRLFIANPDLPRRFAESAPLNEPDPNTFYGGGEKGYTDYPTLEETASRDARA